MKRVYMVIGLLAVMVGLSLHSFSCIGRAKDQVVSQINRIEDILKQDEPANLQQEIDALVNIWTKEENTLRHYVRHGKIDEIENRIAPVSVLAANGEYEEIHENLTVIVWQIERLWESERPIMENIF